MASVQKEIIVEADVVDVWAVIGDFPAGPVRMAPSFVTDSQMDGRDVRVVTFDNGMVLRERLIAVDHEARRIAFSVIGGTMQPTHDNASMQVFDHGDGRSRLVWIHDVKPDHLATLMAAGMDRGLNVFKETLQSLIKHARHGRTPR